MKSLNPANYGSDWCIYCPCFASAVSAGRYVQRKGIFGMAYKNGGEEAEEEKEREEMEKLPH